MDRASRTVMFSHGRNHRTPPISIRRDPKVATTPQGSLRPSELQFSKSTSGAVGHGTARDQARMNLARSETRPTSEANSQQPSRTANANPFSHASVQMQTSSQHRLQSLRRRHRILPKAICSMRTVDHAWFPSNQIGGPRELQAGIKDREKDS